MGVYEAHRVLAGLFVVWERIMLLQQSSRTCICLIFLAVVFAPANAREWKDVTGQYTLEADLIGFDDDAAGMGGGCRKRRLSKCCAAGFQAFDLSFQLSQGSALRHRHITFINYQMINSMINKIKSSGFAI